MTHSIFVGGVPRNTMRSWSCRSECCDALRSEAFVRKYTLPCAHFVELRRADDAVNLAYQRTAKPRKTPKEQSPV
jgi:hypothetical protein